MAQKDAPIPDDWEDVADDNLSIVSLPTSDEEADTDTDTDTKAAAKTKHEIQPEHAADPPSYVTSFTNSLATLSVAETTELYAKQQEKDVRSAPQVEAATEKHHMKSHSPQTDDYNDEESHLGDGLDVDMDPNFLHKVSTSTVKLISEILSIAHSGASYHGGEDTTNVRNDLEDLCERLRQHLNELTPIMEGYSKHWNPEMATVSLPIDPGLYDWMSDLKVELLGVQALLQNQMSSHSAESRSSTFVSDLVNYNESLERSCDQMTSFIPIMKVDYDDFHTANLPVADEREISDARVSDYAEVGRRFSNPGRLSGHAQLRREVYELKDQISACTEGLKDVAERQPQSAKRRFYQLKNSYDSIKATLDILLSNHASEWIDHGLAGGITFPEFYRLNPDTIRSLNVELKEVADNLKMERIRAQQWRYASDPDMMLEYEPEALETAIDTLKTIREVLEDVFRVNKKQSTNPEA